MAKKSKARTARKSPARKKAAAKARPAIKAKKATRPKAARKAAVKRTPGVPAGFTSVTPHMVVSSAERAIAFYKKAFGAEEVFRMPAPDGKRLMHAQLRVMGSPIMMADEFPEFSANKGPDMVGSTTVTLHLYVSNADEVFDRAVKAGCTVLAPLTDMFWGDRFGKLRDPFGHEWSIGQHLRDVSPAEMAAAAKKVFAS
jgi:uncharacterized glyoxalase superfamily protein PhnB